MLGKALEGDQMTKTLCALGFGWLHWKSWTWGAKFGEEKDLIQKWRLGRAGREIPEET